MVPTERNRRIVLLAMELYSSDNLPTVENYKIQSEGHPVARVGYCVLLFKFHISPN